MSDNTVVTENTVTNIVEVTSAGPAGPPGGALTIQDEGVDEGLLTDKINFAGSTVSVVNDTEAEIATITVNAADPGANANITSMTGITGGISSPDFIQFDTAAAATGAVGRILWNDTDGTLEFQMKGGNVTLQIGKEEVVRVTNQSGATMNVGQVVYITGSTGNHLNVTLSQANSEATSSKTLAVIAETIENNQTGFATTSGIISNLDTSALTEGAAIWLSPTVAGGITSTKPDAPNHAVLIGWCIRQNASTGAIYVHIANGYELDELHNVLITSVADKQVIRYDAATGLWKNVTISPTVTLTGAVTGEGTLTDLGSVSIATTATADPTLTLSGDATGSATFTNLGDATLSVTVVDDSHNHIISNVDGLQDALDLKAPLASPTFTGTVTLPSTTSVGTVSATEIGYLDGVSSAIQTQLNAKEGAITTLAVGKGGTGTSTAFTTGSVVFAGASGVYSQDNANLFWDDTNNLLGLGTTTPNDYAFKNLVVNAASGNTGITISAISTAIPTLAFAKGSTGTDRFDGMIQYINSSSAMTFHTSAGTERMRLNSSGNLGVGTISPSARLSVVGADGIVALVSGATKGARFRITSGEANIEGVDNSGTSSYQPLNIGGSYLTLATGGTERMRVAAGGDVGIGTAVPTEKLSVSGNGLFTNATYCSVGTTSGTVQGQFAANSAGAVNVRAVSNHPITFFTNNVEVVRLTTAGDLGVGTSSPGSKVDIVAQDALRITGFQPFQTLRDSNDSNKGFRIQTAGGATIFANDSTGGGTYTERFRLTATGDVGIATTTTVNARLSLGNLISNKVFSLFDDGTNQYGMGIAGLQYRLFAATGGNICFGNYARGTDTFTETVRITSTGNMGVGTSIPDVVRLRTKGSNTAATDYAFYAENSSNVDLFYARNDGAIGTGTATNSPYNRTTASAANVFVTSAGLLERSTSSARYKSDIQDAVHGLDEVMQLRPVTYKGLNDGDTVFGGLIAEEVDAAGLSEFVAYDEQGHPDALHYGPMVSLLVKAMQQQQAIINELSGRVAELEGM